MADAKLKTAIANLERFVPLFQGIIDLSEAAKDIGNVEQAVGEHRVILAGLRGELEAAAAERDAAKEEAAKWRKDASEEAAAMKARAETEAADIVASAEAEAAVVAQDAAAKLSDAQSLVAEAQAEADQAVAATAAAKSEYNDLTDKIYAAKATMHKMLEH